MTIVYRNVAPTVEPAQQAPQTAAEAKEYADRLRKIEKGLLCQALGGPPPQHDSQQGQPRYFDGEIQRADVFHPLYYPATRGQLY